MKAQYAKSPSYQDSLNNFFKFGTDRQFGITFFGMYITTKHEVGRIIMFMCTARDEQGGTMVEYAVVISLFSIAACIGLLFVSRIIDENLYDTASHVAALNSDPWTFECQSGMVMSCDQGAP